MRRYGRFVDSIWIHQRMRAKDARFEREAAARAAAARREADLTQARAAQAAAEKEGAQ
jgi:hypothetical protein